jgi:CheY-like chemotaxis protein
MKARILIIDDETTFLKACSEHLTLSGYDCETCTASEDGFKKLTSSMYDIVVSDVLIPFRGQREGGILLAQEFSERYPTSSIILVSQYVTARWIKMLAGTANFVFVEKKESLFEDLSQEIERIIKTKYCFVCMPFKEEFDDVYELGIKPVVQNLGFMCERASEIQHNKGILETIYDRIDKAHIIIGDMTGQNPNVYYEIGYAHALKKEVLLLTQKVDDIPFDLRGFNHIVYGGKITTLKKELHLRIEAVYKPSQHGV